MSVLPSPSEVIAAKVKRSQESYQGGTTFVISLKEFMCSLLMLLVFFFAFLATPRQGSAVRDPKRQLGPEGFDTPDGPRPIARQESSASIAVGFRCRNDTDFFSIIIMGAGSRQYCSYPG